MDPKTCYTSFQVILILLMNQAWYSAANTDPEQPCNTCCQGLPGLSGRDGVPGRDGIVGRDGLDGSKGDSGSKGDAGIGERGLPGPAGPEGTQGEKGKRGLRGVPGKVGPVGDSGLPGEAGIIGLKGELSISKRSAFSVQKSGSQTSSTNGEIVTFDEARVNIGSHFDLSTNRFTCQIPGLYFFSFSLYGSGPRSPDAVIKKDDETLAYARSSSVDFEISLSSSTMVHLDAGNQVWMVFSSTSETFEGRDRQLCQFNGLLIYED